MSVLVRKTRKVERKAIFGTLYASRATILGEKSEFSPNVLQKNAMNIFEYKSRILDKINDELDLPFVSEEKEGEAIEFLVGKVIDFVPVNLLPLVFDALDGLTRDELALHKAAIVDSVNSRIDIPYGWEAVEADVIGMGVDAVLNPLLIDESV